MNNTNLEELARETVGFIPSEAQAWRDTYIAEEVARLTNDLRGMREEFMGWDTNLKMTAFVVQSILSITRDEGGKGTRAYKKQLDELGEIIGTASGGRNTTEVALDLALVMAITKAVYNQGVDRGERL